VAKDAIAFGRKQMTDIRNLADNREQTRHELLEKRMQVFAANVIRTLGKHKALHRSLADQLIRSSASIGANYAEACNAASKQDFRNKIYISKKEAAEARYWIDLCMELSSPADWVSLRQEVHEILVILQTIINTLSGKSAK
jgi:four helix bundle protein